MTVFRNEREPDPGPAAEEQIAQSETLTWPPKGVKALFTGQDAGLSQSLGDLRKGYADASRLQSDADREAAIHRANADAEIKANTPGTKVKFIGDRPEQYEVGDASQIPGNDPAWRIPTAKLRENLELTEKLYGKRGALNNLLASGSPQDAAHAVELEDQLRRSMGEAGLSLPTMEEGPATEPTITENPDGTFSVKYSTGEVFSGTAREVLQKTGKAHASTKNWARGVKTQAQEALAQMQEMQQQQPQPQWQQEAASPPTAMLPASQVQYDENGAPIVAPGVAVVPDDVYLNWHNIAQAAGFSGFDELAADWQASRQRTEQVAQRTEQVAEALRADQEERVNKEVAAAFMAEHQEFPNSPEAIEKLTGLIVANGMQFTPQTLALAHDHAIRTGLYAPLSQEDIAASVGMVVDSRRQAPPPIIHSSAPDNQGRQQNEWERPLADLRADVIRQQLGGSYR